MPISLDRERHNVRRIRDSKEGGDGIKAKINPASDVVSEATRCELPTLYSVNWHDALSGSPHVEETRNTYGRAGAYE